MNNTFIRNIAIKWLLDSLNDFAVHQDWNKVRLAVEARVAAAVPGQFFDKPALVLVDEVIDAVHATLLDRNDLMAIVNDCLAQNWDKAYADLKAMVLKATNPSDAQRKLAAAMSL